MTPAQSRDLSFVSWLICGALVALAVFSSFQPSQEKDFVYFYGLGTLFNQHVPLYDYPAQTSVFEGIRAIHGGPYGPSPYPPFVALAFAPFAHLPFEIAYHVWMAASIMLYVAALLLLISQKHLLLVLPLAISCWPFVTRTFLSGQLSVVAFASTAFAMREAGRRHPYRSGLLLSISLYKPTLLFLAVPMLVVCGRLKILAGLCMGAVALVAAST